MNRALLLAVSILTLAARPALAADPAPDGRLETDHIIVPPPGDGFKWVKVRDVDQGPVHVTVYLAQKEGSAAKVVLVAGLPAPAGDKGRADVLAGFYDGITSSMAQQGYKEVKAQRPALKAPIPSRVAFTVTCKDPAGNDVATEAVIRFTKDNAYQLQVQAPTVDEAKKLAGCVDALKEK